MRVLAVILLQDGSFLIYSLIIRTGGCLCTKKFRQIWNFVDREKNVEKFWEENHIFEKSMENRKEGETYTFYDGPPTANGKPHIGHVLTRVIKDMIPRYQTMKGKMVPQ